MKKSQSILLIIFTLLLISCVDSQFQVLRDYEVPCTIYEEMGATAENSLIAARVQNPCNTQRLLVAAVRLGVIWDAYTVKQFDTWSDRIYEILDAGISYADLQDLIALQVAQFNAKVGGTFLVLSTILVQFPDREIIREKDAVLMKLSVENVKTEVAKLALLWSTK